MYEELTNTFKYFRFRQGFRRVFQFFCPCCTKFLDTSSSNTTRGHAGGMENHTVAGNITQFDNSCHEIHRIQGMRNHVVFVL